MHERSSKKRREDLIDSVVEAFTMDRTLSGLLNVAVCEHSSDDLEANPESRVVVVTTTKVHYHEPAGYTSRVRLILTSTGKYCIQVKFTLPVIIFRSSSIIIIAYVGSAELSRKWRNIKRRGI